MSLFVRVGSRIVEGKDLQVIERVTRILAFHAHISAFGKSTCVTEKIEKGVFLILAR